MAEEGQAAAAPAVGRIPPTWLIMGVYFVQAVGLSNWFPRIPDVQQRLGLSSSELAICILGMSLGSIAVTLISGPVIDRLTPRRAMIGGLVLFYVALILPGLAWNGPSLFLLLVLMGGGYVCVDVAMNVEAARIQATVGRRILNTCHGVWSLGSVAGSLTAGAFAQGMVPPAMHLALVSLVCLPVGLGIVRALPPAPPAAGDGATRRPVFVLPTVAMLGLCIYAFGTILAELATRNWSSVFMRETLGTSASATGWGLGIFSLMMAAGRLSGDRLADRFGPVAVGRFCAASAIAGVLLLVFASGLPMALAGCAAIGLGVSVGFPLSISAAAQRGDRPPALNVASLSLIAYSGSLIGPPLVGFVADGAGLRVGLAALLPLMVLSALFAGALAPRAPATDSTSAEEGN